MIEGDTLTVLDAANRQQRVRLAGIDAPEKSQPFGTKARDRMAQLAMRQMIELEVSSTDKYGRTLATVQAGGVDVGRQLVTEGLAWHYKRFSNDRGLADADAQARAARRGLWADRKPIPPWEWRASEQGRRPQPAGR